jgi:hypothetical protein
MLDLHAQSIRLSWKLKINSVLLSLFGISGLIQGPARYVLFSYFPNKLNDFGT